MSASPPPAAAASDYLSAPEPDALKLSGPTPSQSRFQVDLVSECGAETALASDSSPPEYSAEPLRDAASGGEEAKGRFRVVNFAASSPDAAPADSAQNGDTVMSDGSLHSSPRQQTPITTTPTPTPTTSHLRHNTIDAGPTFDFYRRPPRRWRELIRPPLRACTTSWTRGRVLRDESQSDDKSGRGESYKMRQGAERDNDVDTDYCYVRWREGKTTSRAGGEEEVNRDGEEKGAAMKS
ncbi:hypothetical protein cypCar_00037520 [Cyprinus carpio]|nr:hypothetical protein cypCar_00037520 [Cyprinus carpio]